jgi:acyl carrier protein
MRDFGAQSSRKGPGGKLQKGQIEKTVKQILGRFITIGEGEDSRKLVLLTEGGLFDSVTALEVILELEGHFKIVIRDDEVCAENLESFEAIARFVEAKLSTV